MAVNAYLNRNEMGIITEKDQSVNVVNEDGEYLFPVDLSGIDLKHSDILQVVVGETTYNINLHSVAPQVPECSNVDPPIITNAEYPPIITNAEDPPIVTNAEQFQWDKNSDALFLDLFEKNKAFLGTKKFLTKNALFNYIAGKMRDMGFDVTKEQVQNHDKLISRRLKNIMSNVGPKSSGRGRISFLNETKVLEVYGKRPNINPEYVSESSVGEVTHANKLQRLENLSNKENEGNSSSPSVQESPKSSRRESKTSLSIAALKESMDEQNLAMKERNRHLAKIANDNE